MNPIDFSQTIYLGDRFCKGIQLNSFDGEVKIKVNSISRVRGDTWNFYIDEDIEDGFIVIAGVSSIAFEPSCYMPNEWIEIEAIEPLPNGSEYRFTFNIGSMPPNSTLTKEMRLIIIARTLCLEDSMGKRIIT